MTDETNPLPKWVMYRYARLWNKFNSQEFTYEEAKRILEGDEDILSAILSELKKHGWLFVSLDPDDSRKRIYQLKSPELVLKSMGTN